jgi:CspA family cold shock protein
MEEQRTRYLQSDSETAQKITNMREKGTIKRYLPERGFGFIETDGGGADLFLHVSELRPEFPQSAIREGAQVMFEVSHKYGRPRAVDVELALYPDGRASLHRARGC